MAGDRARVSYDPSRKYRGLVAQQGRVAVEADWNEAAAIAAESGRLTTLDVVGPVGTPDGGYTVTPDADGDLTIGPGTLYVGGERFDLDAEVTYSTQPDWLDHSTDQPPWEPPAVPAGTGYELVYLVASEQEVSAVEDPALADVALGGPDTMQRQRILQRFVRTPSQSPSCANAWDVFTGALGANGQQFDSGSMMITSTATLQVSFPGMPTTPSLCQPVAAGGYLGAENQMIRVMIASVEEGVPTIVWGFDDASFLYRITTAVPDAGSGTTTLTFAAAPVDSYHYPQPKQTVELLRDAVELTPPDSTAVPPYPGDYIASAAGFATSAVGAYDPVQAQLVVSGSPSADYLNTSITPQLYLRVWQDTVTATPGQAVTLGDTGVAVTLNSTTGAFHAGDFWRFALRPIQPAIVYPARYQQGPQPPDGPRTWACPLAVLTWTNGSGTALSCVPSFANLVQLTGKGGCCTVDVSPSDVGGGVALQALIDSYVKPNQGPVTICLEPGVYTLPAPLVLGPEQDGLTLQACRGGVTLQADEASLAFSSSSSSSAFSSGLITLASASSVTIRGITLAVPLARFSPPDNAFSFLPTANKELLENFSRSLLVAIGILCADATGLTVTDCTFTFEIVETNVFGVGIFATGEMEDLTVSGCTVLTLDPPTSFPFYGLATINQGDGPWHLTFGYLQLPAPSAQTTQYLDNATFDRCSFEGVTVAALAMTMIGAIGVSGAMVSGCYGGFWLLSFTDPAVITALDTIATGDAAQFAEYSQVGLAPLLDRIFVLASAMGQLLLAQPAPGAMAVPAPGPEQLSRASQLVAQLASAGAARPQAAAPPTEADISLQLDFGHCQVDAAVAGSYTGAGLFVGDLAEQTGSVLVHDSRITDRFPFGDTVLLWELNTGCVTGNVIANEVVPTTLTDDTSATSRSIVVDMLTPLGVPAVAVTGNVFIDPTLLPARPATIPTPLGDWDVLNTVIDYLAPPVVTGISPAQGVPGTTVTISGSGFTGMTGVAFGKAAATSKTLNSDSQITAVAPPGSGTVDVIVTNPVGTSPATAADQFTYLPPPVVTNLDPNNGPSGMEVTITGTGFTGATGVMFGTTPAAKPWGVVSDTQINATVPPGPPGTGLVDAVNVTVTTPAGTSAVTPADQFFYPVME